MDSSLSASSLEKIAPRTISNRSFVRAYNTRIMTFFGREWFFDSEWSYGRGYRFNYKLTCPVLYLWG